MSVIDKKDSSASEYPAEGLWRQHGGATLLLEGICGSKTTIRYGLNKSM